uniref:Arrestin-like N-terminal domain-containing protein n=1 Tax=Taeniopygia guttata TaxID=59729 RepID=A0A674HL99_TAEGU
MGKVQLFEIRLGDSRVVYSPGEPLAGTVTVRLSGSLQYRAIKVSCIGSCGVSNKINDTAWTVEEQYFNSTLSLADKGTVHKGLVQISQPSGTVLSNNRKWVKRTWQFLVAQQFSKQSF